MMLKNPRFISPELVDIGDLITVERPAVQGIVTTLKGTVASRETHGKTHFYKTAEGGTLFVSDPSRARVKIILLGRADVINESLFELDEIKTRIA